LRTHLLHIFTVGVAFGVGLVNCGPTQTTLPFEPDNSGGSAGLQASGGSTAHGTGGSAGGSTGGSTPAAGGSTTTGGTTATGGSNASGGTTATGGSSATGAASGTGGSAMAGKSGAGGRAAGGAGRGAAGRANTGGRSGVAGAATGGSAGASAPPTPLDCSAPPAALSGGTQHCSSNAQGNVGSYSWNIWSSGGGGCITPYGVDAAFKATWNNSGDFLARVGLALGSKSTYDKLGTFVAQFNETKTGSGGSYNYIGIYGWSENPLKEFYIADDWFGGHPNPGTKMGTFMLDDGTYDVYKHTQNNQPAITGGNQTFDQYISLRQTARQCGTISITEHFKEWAKLGLTLGNLEEVRILVEAGGGSGSIDFSAATLVQQQ